MGAIELVYHLSLVPKEMINLSLLKTLESSLIKSPWVPGVTLCFCTGSYAAMCTLLPPAADFIHAMTPEQLFGFLSVLSGLMALIYRFPD